MWHVHPKKLFYDVHVLWFIADEYNAEMQNIPTIQMLSADHKQSAKPYKPFRQFVAAINFFSDIMNGLRLLGKEAAFFWVNNTSLF